MNSLQHACTRASSSSPYSMHAHVPCHTHHHQSTPYSMHARVPCHTHHHQCHAVQHACPRVIVVINKPIPPDSSISSARMRTRPDTRDTAISQVTAGRCTRLVLTAALRACMPAWTCGAKWPLPFPLSMLLLALIALTASAAVYQAGESGYSCFRIPDVLLTANGTLLAFDDDGD